MKMRYWLNSGANIHSKYERTMDIDITQEEWGEMTDDDKDEFMREYCFENADWGYSVVE